MTASTTTATTNTSAPPSSVSSNTRKSTEYQGAKQVSIELRRKHINTPSLHNTNNANNAQLVVPTTSSKTAVVSSAAREDNTQWLHRVRQVQLSAMTPEQREELRRKHDEQADRLANAKKLHSITHRTQNAKTTSYYAMDPGAVNRKRQSTALSAQQGQQQPRPNVESVNNASALVQAPPAPVLSVAPRQEQANALMNMMDEDDDIIAESFAVPQRSKKSKKDHGDTTQGLSREQHEGEHREQQEKDNAPVFRALKEEEQMTTSPAWNQQQMEGNEKVTESEEQAALRSLRQEPGTDDERAAKFEVFEKFSNKMMKIRTDLDETVRETVVELPPLPREAINQSLKKLENDKSRGIFDESRFWFVHDMFLTASKNCDLMNEISDEIARKIRMMANNDQSECPVCLLSFVDHNNNNNCQKAPTGDEKDEKDDEEEEPRVEPVVLSCLHKICEECFEQWKRIKGDRVYCPLCRNEEFLRDIAAVPVNE